MDSLSEGYVTICFSLYVKLVRICEISRITVGRVEHLKQHLSLLELVPTQFAVFFHQAGLSRYGAFVSQRFLNSRIEQLGVVSQQLQLVWMSEQGVNCVRDERKRRLVTGSEERDT